MTPYETAKARVEAGDVSFDAIAALANADAMRLLAKAAEPSADDLRDELSDAHQVIFDLRNTLDAMTDRAWEFEYLLKDILDLETEYAAIGGGPGYGERREEAFAAAYERFEP